MNEEQKKRHGDDFIERSKKIHGDVFDYSKVVYVNSSEKVIIICRKHGEFLQRPNDHVNGSGCPECKKEKISLYKKKSLDQVLSEFKKVHGDTYDYSKVVYVNVDTHVEIICRKHGSFMQTPYLHSTGSGCDKCWSERRHNILVERNKGNALTSEYILKRFEEVHGDTFNYDKVKYSKIKDYVIVTCKKHGDFKVTPNNHIGGNGCSKCAREAQRLTQEEYIERCVKIHGNLYDYSKSVYTKGREPITITCRIHGDFTLNKAHYHITKRNGCQKCCNSLGEVKIRQYLDDNNIKYSMEYTFDKCRSLIPLPFDFYLEDYNVCIEFDGQQHFELNTFFGGQEDFDALKVRDEIKNNFCRENGIQLIRIPYWDINCITEILDEELGDFGQLVNL